MKLRNDEQLIMRTTAETMFFNFIRNKRYTLIVTNQRIALKSLFSVQSYELEDIEWIELYKVTLFLPFGVRIQMRDGQKLELAILQRRAVADAIMQARPQIAEF